MINYRRDPQIIHETIVRDVIDLLTTMKDNDWELPVTLKNNRSFKSIAKASSNFVLTFPVIVSKNISIENAAVISKAIERKAVTMLQILFTALNITSSKDAIEYLSKFHTNIKFDNDITIDNMIDTLDKIGPSLESVYIYKQVYEQAKEEYKNNCNIVLPDNINETSLNDYIVKPRAFYGENNIIKLNEATPYDSYNHRESNKKTNQKERQTDTVSNSTTKDRGRDNIAIAKDISQITKTNLDMVKNQLLDSDVKKANELVPSMMVVNFISMQGDRPVQSQMVVGVKAKIYAVDSADILTRVSLKTKDSHGLLNLIKATTREISFVRDFLLAIDKAKVDALSQSNKGSSSKLWKILERRALKSKIRRALGNVNDATAISTLVLSQEEVEYLYKTENINLEDPKVIRNILEAYNLMGFCIVDEVTESAKFIFDTGDDIYETIPFRQLEKENTNNDYKKIVNLINKVSR